MGGLRVAILCNPKSRLKPACKVAKVIGMDGVLLKGIVLLSQELSCSKETLLKSSFFLSGAVMYESD